jgi:hypothetical protein
MQPQEKFLIWWELCRTVMYNRISWPLCIWRSLLKTAVTVGVNNYYAFGYDLKFTFHPHFVSSSLRLGLSGTSLLYGNLYCSTIRLFLPRVPDSFLHKEYYPQPLASPDVPLTLKHI